MLTIRVLLVTFVACSPIQVRSLAELIADGEPVPSSILYHYSHDIGFKGPRSAANEEEKLHMPTLKHTFNGYPPADHTYYHRPETRAPSSLILTTIPLKEPLTKTTASSQAYKPISSSISKVTAHTLSAAGHVTSTTHSSSAPKPTTPCEEEDITKILTVHRSHSTSESSTATSSKAGVVTHNYTTPNSLSATSSKAGVETYYTAEVTTYPTSSSNSATFSKSGASSKEGEAIESHSHLVVPTYSSHSIHSTHSSHSIHSVHSAHSSHSIHSTHISHPIHSAHTSHSIHSTHSIHYIHSTHSSHSVLSSHSKPQSSAGAFTTLAVTGSGSTTVYFSTTSSRPGSHTATPTSSLYLLSSVHSASTLASGDILTTLKSVSPTGSLAVLFSTTPKSNSHSTTATPAPYLVTRPNPRRDDEPLDSTDYTASCTTTLIRDILLEQEPTKTEYASTTTHTSHVPCGTCSLAIIDRFGIGPVLIFTTTITVSDTLTITTEACKPTHFVPPARPQRLSVERREYALPPPMTLQVRPTETPSLNIKPTHKSKESYGYAI
jgi:hypothetical protein